MTRKNIAQILIVVVVAILVAFAVVQKTRVRAKESAASKLTDDPLELTIAYNLDVFRSRGVPVVIDFGADSCIPCKEMAPILVALHDELRG